MIAVGTHDVDALIDVIVEMTTPPPGNRHARVARRHRAWLNRYLLVGVGQLDMTAIIDSGMELLHRHKLVLPADLALLFRVLLAAAGSRSRCRHGGPRHRVAAAVPRVDDGRPLQPEAGRRNVAQFTARAGSTSSPAFPRMSSAARTAPNRNASASTFGSAIPTTRRSPRRRPRNRRSVLAGSAAHGPAGRSDDRRRVDSRSRRRRRRRHDVAAAHRRPRDDAVLGHPGS